MDFTNILEVLPTLTDCQMKVVYDHLTEIQRQRKEAQRKTLISNFKKAYLALESADIFVLHDGIGVGSFDEFEFD